MKLSLNGIKNKSDWEATNITLPGCDVEAAAEKAKAAPRWTHFGIGNIFRIFIGGIATACWRMETWILPSPVWRPLTMMSWTRSIAHSTTWD